MFRIYRNDIRTILRNSSALIVILALCILPSLYAWFNIKAAWDPYAQEGTSQIKIGVVNLDEGTQFQGTYRNIGATVVEELKENHQLGWQFNDEKTARKNLDDGTYFAMITITNDFSKALTSITSSTITKGTIRYTVNEKINAIAPKLTDKGVTSLQAMISKTVVETVSKTVLTLAQEVGFNLEEQIPKLSDAYQQLSALKGKFGVINHTVDESGQAVEQVKSIMETLQKKLPDVETLLDGAKNLGIQVRQFVAISQNEMDHIIPAIRQDMQIASAVLSEVSEYGEALRQALISKSEDAPILIDSMIQKLTSAQKLLDSLSQIINRINAMSSNQPFTGLINQLNGYANTIENGIEGLNGIKGSFASDEQQEWPVLTQLIEVTRQISEDLSESVNSYDTAIAPKIEQVLTNAYNLAGNAVDLMQQAQDKIPGIEKTMTTVFAVLNQGEEGIGYMKNILPEAEHKITEFTDLLGMINSGQELQQLIDLLEADVSNRTDFLAQPVEIIEERLYPIKNYGTGMTPFYTILSLWVGVLLLVSILSVDAKGEYRPHQIYFGKLGLFLTITIIQAVIVGLGDLYLLRIGCQQPFLFLVGCILASITFTFLVYSLVSVFGNVGKVIAIILLVLQVAGSGGTFPIQLIPHFFQVINPAMPFTYGISFLREAIGGPIASVVIRDLIVSGVFILASILVALVLKKPINKAMHKFVVKFHDSGIGA